MKVYHREVGFPESLVIPNLFVHLKYTNHAIKRKARRTPLTNVNIYPTVARINKDTIYEIHSPDDIKCKKVLIRINYDDRKDMILVLEILSKKYARVVTFWINEKTDQHPALDLTKYTKP